MTRNRLHVYMDEQFAGYLTRAPDRSVTFAYDEEYADRLDTTPLSLSMPKSQLEHGNDVAGAWISNLLPDSERKLERLAASVGIRSIQAFDLLSRLGHDVAGAVQMFPEDQEPSHVSDLVERPEQAIAEELRELRTDPDYVPDEFGRWSLAGQQGKIALFRAGGNWYSPTGAAASTHILKIGPDGIEAGDLAEFVTLRAAHYCGVPTANAWLERFEDQLAVVVERYDRDVLIADTGLGQEFPRVRRIHQEDMCQALGVRPGQKYQSDGGPGAKDVASLLRRLPARAREVSVHRFAQLLIFNALTYAPDAHAKNYSILLAGSSAAFAPAYDLMSNAVRQEIKQVRHRTKLAMKTASTSYDADRVTPGRIARLDQELGLPADWAVATATHIVDRVGAAFDLAIDEAESFLGASGQLDSMRQHADSLEALLSERWL